MTAVVIQHPGAAGPVAARQRQAKASVRARLVAGGVALACAGVLGLGAWMEPAAAGHGTHTQIGLPPCGWATAMSLPCPTCGMTTAFAQAADGNLPAAFSAQPLGAALALATAAAFWCTLHVAATGSRLGALGAALLRPRPMWGLAALGVGAWAYKIATWGG